MKKYSSIILLIIVSVLSLQAQDYTFKVLINKGKNEVKAGNVWQPIKAGSTLKLKDEVKLADNAYLGLIHSTGKSLELKEAGNYKVADLSARIGNGTSVLNKYTDFILSSNTQNNNRLAATGSVHRGTNMIKIFLPKSEAAVIYNDNAVIEWEQKPDVSLYVVNLKSMFGDDLLSTETADNKLTINLSDKEFEQEDNIIVEVYPKGHAELKPNPAYMIKRLSAADKARINAQMKEIDEVAKDTSALNQLILAGFFEQNKLFIDAGTAYLKAVELAPDVQQYKDNYNNFLIRNGIKDVKKDK